ncbi:diguanylate cyclase [Zoogloea sp.]|uniref:diguanylate cyclase n=1 Tax=Zoogloea sp. TaxID=49181 RepID=UPI00260EC95D|nr:diguanylate cyclase [Zoogloea sp.]
MVVPLDVTKFEHLKASGDLPSPKGVALAIIRLIQQEDSSMGDLARVIKTDPAFVGRLIKAANGLTGYNRRAIVSVQEALMVLGLPAVRTLALGFSLLSSYRDGNCKSFDYGRYWTGCLVYALAMQAITQRTRVAAAEETFCLGLLVRIGELALATLYPQDYGKVLQQTVEYRDVPLVALEQRAFALNHRELASAMLADWGLPRIFHEPAYFAEVPEESGYADGSREFVIVHSLHLASFVAEVFLAEEAERPNLMSRLFEIGTRLSLDAATVNDLCDGVVREWQAWGSLLELETLEIPPFSELASRGEAIAASLATVARERAIKHDAEPRLQTVTQTQHGGEQLALSAGVLQPMRVLVVDDDGSMRGLVRKVLETVGHQVIEAADGRAGMEMALEFQPQLMIVDWVMPEMNGLELTRALRQTKIGRSIYILIMTGLEDDDRLIEAFENGVDDFMNKPINPRVLAARLRAGQRVIRLQQELDRDREEIRRFAAELAVSNRRLQEVALTDSLTGFPNRRYAIERIQQEWSVSSRTRRPLSGMVIDVDQFKTYNDSHGHDVGDAVLRQVAASIKGALRAQDIVARTGGDEFLVICPDSGLDAALACAERVRFAVESAPLAAGGQTHHMSVSIGVATRDTVMTDPDALIKRADQALYLAKNKGRNRIMTAQSLRPGPLIPPR